MTGTGPSHSTVPGGLARHNFLHANLPAFYRHQVCNECLSIRKLWVEEFEFAMIARPDSAWLNSAVMLIKAVTTALNA